MRYFDTRVDGPVRPVQVLGSAASRLEVTPHGPDRTPGSAGALLIEEADAWFEYLEATRAQSALRYVEVEPWAWARLSQRLRAIRARRGKLRPAAEAA